MARGNVRVSITADARQAQQELKQTGSALDTFSRKGAAGMKHMSGMASTLDSRFGKLAKAATAVGAGYLAIAEGKEAVNVTTDLAKSTISLNKGLGLSVKTASEWAAVAKVRGIDSKALNQSFGTLAKNSQLATEQYANQRIALSKLGKDEKDRAKAIEMLNKGAGGQANAFRKLGVSQDDLVKTGGNFNKLLKLSADGLGRMEPGARRTQVAMQLFGKGWQTIVPILRGGSKAMDEQLNLARKYGATFSGGTIKTMQDLIDAQREAKFATLGLQVAFGTQLAPAMTKAIGVVTTFIGQMRSGKGAGGEFAAKVKEIWKSAQPIVKTFGDVAIAAGKFSAEHPQIAKVAVAVGLTAVALNKLKFVAAVRGMASIVTAAAKVPGGVGAAISGTKAIVSRIMGRAGAAGGTALASNAAGAAGSQFPLSFDKKSGQMKSASAKTMTGVGKLAGVAMTAGMIVGLAGAGAAVAQALRKIKTDVIDPWMKENIPGGGAIGSVRDFIGGNLPDSVPGAPFLKEVFGNKSLFGGKRRGGVIGMRRGGLIPAVLSPGEVGITPGGGTFKVPGPRVAADTVPMMLPQGTAVLTGSGQRMMASGASLGDAIRHQAPHFKDGGVISDRGDWARALLDRLKIHRSATSIYDLNQWAAIEGGHWNNTARFNPLNTSMTLPGSTSINSHGVKAYGSWDQGLSAAAKTLRLGSYTGIVRALRGGTFDDFRTAVLGSPWGTTSIPGGPGPKPGTGIEKGGGSFTRVTPAATTHPLLGNMLDPLVDDALMGGVESGRTNASRRPLLTSVLEGIVPESGDRATRERITIAGKQGVSGKDAPKIINWMKRRADAIDAKGYPYSTPGNRSFGIAGPMDCSGGVSKVIGPGLLSQVYDSTYFKTWGEPGPGKYLTTYSKGGTGASGHVFLNLLGKDWGTSSQNDGGGAGWFNADAGYKSQFIARHPKGMRGGGVVGHAAATRRDGSGGVLKVTPFSRFYQWAKKHRHELNRPPAVDDDGTPNNGVGIGVFQAWVDEYPGRNKPEQNDTMEGGSMTRWWDKWNEGDRYRGGGVIGRGVLNRLPARLLKNSAVVAEVLAGGVMPGMRGGGWMGAGFDDWLEGLPKGRKPTLIQLVMALGSENLGSSNADLATRTLSGRLPGRRLGALLAAQKRARSQIRTMSRKGFTGPERIKTRRLRGAISLLQDQMGRPIGRALGASDRAQERISRAESLLPYDLQVGGIDPESVQGLQAQRGQAVSAVAALEQRKAALAVAARRAARTPGKADDRLVQQERNEVDDQIKQLNASIKGLDTSIQQQAKEAPKNWANAELALASLTDTLDDDKAATQKLVNIYQGDLGEALASGDPLRIAEAANNLKSAQDAMKSLAEQMSQASDALTEAIKAQTDSNNRLASLIASQAPAIQKAMAAATSGAIGGSYGLGRLTPSFPGSRGLWRS